MENLPQDSDIINTSDLDHIMADLSQDNQNFLVFLEQEEYVDINKMCDSTQEVKREPSGNVGSGDGAVVSSYRLANCNSNVRPSTGHTPSVTDYPGPFNFETLMAGSTLRKGSWIYSSKLKKVFIDVNKVMLIKFKVGVNCPLGLKVRALLVYSAPDHMNQAVSRCTLHKFNLDPNQQAHAQPDVCLCQDYNLVGHVLVTDHSQATYEFNPESQRHSVLVPLGLPPPGSDTITIAYQFGCKNSCPGGMSRRAVNVIFTLETPNGDVLGRRRLSVKICSCPKRDKEREELEYDKGCLPGNESCQGRKRCSPYNLRESVSTSNKREKFDFVQYDDLKTYQVKTEVFDRLFCHLDEFQQTFDVLRDQLKDLKQVLENIHNVFRRTL